MPTHCRHEVKKQSPSYEEIKPQTEGYTHIINPSLAPEKHFEPWNLSDPPKNRKYLPHSDVLNEASSIKPSDAPYFSRNYGWDETEQSEEEAKRLRQLLSIWDAERIAILKLQHDLDKSVFHRTFDYIKRIGQSIGLALWLWVHRPANCSNIASLNYPDTPSYLVIDHSNDQEGQDISLPPLDTLPDSLWLKRFVLDEPQENLPPIARAMKNMLDNDTLVWTSKIQEEDVWPHFINRYRMAQNKTFLRNLHGNNEYQSSVSPKYTTDESITNLKVTDSGTGLKTKPDSHSSEKIVSSTDLTNNPLEQQQTMVNISQPIDNQSELKPIELSPSKDKRRKQKHKSKKKGRSKSKDKQIKTDKVRRRSRSKSPKPRSRTKSTGRKKGRRAKSKKRNSNDRSKSKERRSSSKSKPKSRTSLRRSKSKGRKSSPRSKSKNKRKHITARTIK